MAYRYGNREQFGLFPQSIEDYVGKEDPVRAYDAFVESLDFTELGIDIDEHQIGNSEYDPRAMLKLLVYGYSYGIKIGIWLGLIAAAVITYGGYLGMQEQGTSLSDVRGQASGALGNMKAASSGGDESAGAPAASTTGEAPPPIPPPAAPPAGEPPPLGPPHG